MSIRMTRRELALAAAAGMASASAQEAEKTYGGALDGTNVDAKAFDPVAWTMQRHDSAPLKLTFKASTRKQTEAWQKQLRAKVVELIGGLPATGGPLRAQTLERSGNFRRTSAKNLCSRAGRVWACSDI